MNQVGRAVMDAAFAVHRELGPGLLESVYEHCLASDLTRAGLAVERQVAIPVHYRDDRLDVGFRLDLLVERQVIVEVKAIDALASIHTAQILTYLRFSQVRLGYLINFNTPWLSLSGFMISPAALRRVRRDIVVLFVMKLFSPRPDHL